MDDQDEVIRTAQEELLPADELRRQMAALESEKFQAYLRHKEAADRAFRDFVDHFLHDHLTRKDIAEMRRKVVGAAEHGQFEVMVMRFPSSLCEDKGRAINNGLPGWERTLPGKAHEAYEVWMRAGRGKGFRLFAKILDYPGGMPGDVGVFLSWAPPVKA
jgi:hypothetical protein